LIGVLTFLALTTAMDDPLVCARIVARTADQSIQRIDLSYPETGHPILSPSRREVEVIDNRVDHSEILRAIENGTDLPDNSQNQAFHSVFSMNSLRELSKFSWVDNRGPYQISIENPVAEHLGQQLTFSFDRESRTLRAYHQGKPLWVRSSDNPRFQPIESESDFPRVGVSAFLDLENDIRGGLQDMIDSKPTSVEIMVSAGGRYVTLWNSHAFEVYDSSNGNLLHRESSATAEIKSLFVDDRSGTVVQQTTSDLQVYYRDGRNRAFRVGDSLHPGTFFTLKNKLYLLASPVGAFASQPLHLRLLHLDLNSNPLLLRNHRLELPSLSINGLSAEISSNHHQQILIHDDQSGRAYWINTESLSDIEDFLKILQEP
jgi:hypothetical protein